MSEAPCRPTPVLVVMGVSGSGKTTVAERLADKLGWPFAEGDGFHPPANVAKMHAGRALTDADRWPWLDSIGAWIDGRQAAGMPGIVSCSALKRAYRDRLDRGRPGVAFVYLEASFERIAARLAQRRGHFMPASLLASQFATLEEPDPDEPVIAVEAADPPGVIVEFALARLAAVMPWAFGAAPPAARRRARR